MYEVWFNVRKDGNRGMIYINCFYYIYFRIWNFIFKKFIYWEEYDFESCYDNLKVNVLLF